MAFENYSSVLKIYQNLESVNKQNKEQGLHDYSLINALLKANDEVRLHSKFIYSMINPKGSHYCDTIFLEKFLAGIGLIEFIDSKNACVYREKDNIDLLITDGSHFVIIENKLDAADQKHQITRYIQKVIEKFRLDQNADLSVRIVVVYLSKTKSKPSDKNKSIIGFRFEPQSNPGLLVWLNSEVPLNSDDQPFTLKDNTQFRYIHMNYFGHVRNWVESSINWLESDHRNRNSLIHCFKYEMILNRLDNSKRWKNIMSLDEYTLQIKEDAQQLMYELMVDAQQALPKYIGKKLYSVISEKFNESIVVV